MTTMTVRRLNRLVRMYREACKLALKRLEQLGAEEQDPLGEPLGPCPACEAIRKAIDEDPLAPLDLKESPCGPSPASDSSERPKPPDGADGQ